MTTIPRIGDDYAGYRLESLIGRGGMSVVYRATNMRLGSEIALKILAPELAEDDTFRERFTKESRTAAAMNHPNIVTIYDAGSADGLLYIAMRYVEGPDLRVVLNQSAPLPLDRTLSIFRQVGSALDAAHQRGLVHRDVKPGIVLIDVAETADSTDHVYLTDFGLTKHASSGSGMTLAGQFVGTVDYCAPEQIQGKPLDGRADIYSLGCVLYECLTGVAPFRRDAEAAVLWAHIQDEAAPVSTLRRDLTPEIDSVVGKAMAKSPNDRYATCRELVAALRSEILAIGIQPNTPSAGMSQTPDLLEAEVGAEGSQRGNPPSGPRLVAGATVGGGTMASLPTELDRQEEVAEGTPGRSPPTPSAPGFPGGGPESGSSALVTTPRVERRGDDRQGVAVVGARPPTGRRPRVLTFAVAAVVLIAAMGGEALLLRNRGTTASTRQGGGSSNMTPGDHGGSMGNTSFTAVQNNLLEHIPKAIQSSCKPKNARPALSVSAYASLQCSPGGVVGLLQYNSMHDGVAMRTNYQLIQVNHHLLANEGNCAGDIPHGEKPWYSMEGGPPDGRVTHVLGHKLGSSTGRAMCYEENGLAWIEWYDSDTHVYAFASTSLEDYPALYEWWLKSAGPDHPSHGSMTDMGSGG
jgi:serine/threonine protein kinase